MARSTTEDKDLLAVREEENAELEKSDAEIESLINKSDKFFDNQAYEVKEWGDKQTELQKENLDFTIDTINQQKDQARKDYEKEQSGAYVDWQKQSNPYGANAEKMASAGMANSGYSESSQVSMYNAYQSRLTAARESYNRAVLNYDNAIKEAQLQNSSILAEIAYDTLQKQLELSLQGFQYKNTLILEKANARRQIKSLYQSKYTDILNQINIENAREEEKRQFDILHPNVEIENSEQIEKPDGNEKGKLADMFFNFLSNLGKKTDSTESANDNGKTEIKNKSILNSATITYDQALNFLNSNNLTAGGHRLENKFEWEKNKKSKKLGEWYNYPSYEAYLRGFLTWRLEER